MDNFFGVSTTTLALGALSLLALAAAALAFRAYRWPIFARLGLRLLGRFAELLALRVEGLIGRGGSGFGR